MTASQTNEQPNPKQYTFIDLFAGIGGFRLGMTRQGFQCVFSSEIDEPTCQVYEENFGENPYCDISIQDEKALPDFDVLCGGFPCQPFSKAGRLQGFSDTRGTLFFHILRILEHKKPKAFILENVNTLFGHDKGNTFKVIKQSLESLGYYFSYSFLDASDFGVPQSRRRIIMIGTLDKPFDFDRLEKNEVHESLSYLDDFQDPSTINPKYAQKVIDKKEYTLIKDSKRQKSKLHFIGYLNGKTIRNGFRLDQINATATHRQQNRIYDASGLMPALVAGESSGRYWVHYQDKVRKLTLNECYRFMGFPQDFKLVGGQSNLYKRIGNSVCVNMVEQLAIAIKQHLG